MSFLEKSFLEKSFLEMSFLDLELVIRARWCHKNPWGVTFLLWLHKTQGWVYHAIGKYHICHFVRGHLHAH